MIPRNTALAAAAAGLLFLCGICPLLAQLEPPHPILSIPGSGSGAGTILSSWTESQYTNNFTPRLAPRNDDYGFVPAVVAGDTGWSWSSSAPNQITSTPSGTVFPNGGYTVLTQAVTVMNGNTVNAPYYLRDGSATAKSLVFNLIAHNQRSKLRSDLNALAPAYMLSGATHAARNQNYARRIAIALLDWARWFPNYIVTAKNSASFINTVNTTFTDNGLVNGTTYYYVLSGVNQIGEGPVSAQASATPNAFAPTGMVARLTFDDNTANDSSGHGNHGTLMNGASIITDAQRGKVLLLDGANDYVDLGNGASLNLSDNNQATITAWVKLAASQNHNTILSKGEWKEAYALIVKGDTTPDDQLWTGNDTSVFSGTGVPLNTWTHVAVTVNSDLTTFYLNGQIAGAANQDRGNPLDNTATGVSVGREQYTGSMPAGRWFFNGQLDDVRIYERVLTQAEIQSVMVGTPPATQPRITGVTMDGTNLILNGTNGTPGMIYYVLTTTNIALPAANWTRVMTNTFGPGGEFNFTNGVNPLVPQSFYALQIP